MEKIEKTGREGPEMDINPARDAITMKTTDIQCVENDNANENYPEDDWRH